MIARKNGVGQPARHRVQFDSFSLIAIKPLYGSNYSFLLCILAMSSYYGIIRFYSVYYDVETTIVAITGWREFERLRRQIIQQRDYIVLSCLLTKISES